MQLSRESWGIVGGGLLGITLAYRLSQLGKNVTLFEAAPEPGGLAGTCNFNGFRWDKFYHVILKSDIHLRKLLTEIQLEEKINWVETRTGFYSGGKFYSMSGIWEFLKFPPLMLIDKLRLAATILYASYEKNWRKLEAVHVEQWLKKWSGKNTYEKIWQPLLRAKLGESYKETSAAFIWATIQRMYAARKNGLKKEMFGYMPAGYSTILNRLLFILNENGVAIKSNYAVSLVESLNNHSVKVSFSNDTTETFDHVITTIPSVFTAKICTSISAEEKQKHSSITYLGVICLSLVLKKPLSGFYITNITDHNFPFTGVIEMSALVDKKQFNGNHLVYLPKYVLADSPDFLFSDDTIFRKYFAGLKKMYPDLEDADVAAWRVSKAKHVFALPRLNYSRHIPSLSAGANLHIVNSAYLVNSTLNVNETIKLAENSLEQILSGIQIQKNTTAVNNEVV